MSNLFLNGLLYIVEAKKGCKKKSLNILSLAAYLLKVKIIIQVKFTHLYTLFVHFSDNVQSLQLSMIPFHVIESNA